MTTDTGLLPVEDRAGVRPTGRLPRAGGRVLDGAGSPRAAAGRLPRTDGRAFEEAVR
ncbi:hypothetical protein [Streptomyces diastatochromogenes]|uniref:hypothetical protein n=1 Tax=Streptomyces diastatochromogenes TaxID=42236 RepID=UPI003676A43F